MESLQSSPVRAIDSWKLVRFSKKETKGNKMLPSSMKLQFTKTGRVWSVLMQMSESISKEGYRNHTSVAMFVLLGLTSEKDLQLILFPVFLVIYLVTLISNLGLIILIRMDSQLHTPMYFFLSCLSCLSFIDICYSTSISPRMLSDLFKDRKTISFVSCATQYSVFAWMGLSECCILATMAYDRYVAIGNPLQYTTIMNPNLCCKMVTATLGSGLIGSLVETLTCINLYYCGPNVIRHFFCDLPQIVSLSCSNTFVCQVMIFLVALLFGFGSMLFILLSYGFIAASILKISSAKGSLKAFNTCASHLAVVTLFYGTCLSVYMSPNSNRSRSQDKVLSVFYVNIIPMLNPLIYSLRNKEIKEALKKVMKRTRFLSQ
ncbi:olfactory receptor 1440-like [Sorex araneus]|uniref:olfactory receptor 1440-like n=1 Tax=Sorex araneus TaxID=42254 RepID=UPI00243387E9|nr:olfactory receptor 1440-like [Sorex araneus]XP_054999779.1 olfactory receptor 1440-like [Sorex araneus]